MESRKGADAYEYKLLSLPSQIPDRTRQVARGLAQQRNEAENQQPVYHQGRSDGSAVYDPAEAKEKKEKEESA